MDPDRSSPDPTPDAGAPAPDGRDAGAPDWAAIARWLAGESDPAESAAVGAWLAAHPEDAGLVAALDDAAGGVRLGPAPATGETAPDVERALAAVRARIAADGDGDAAAPHAIPHEGPARVLPLPAGRPARVTAPAAAAPARARPAAEVRGPGRWGWPRQLAVAAGLACAAALGTWLVHGGLRLTGRDRVATTAGRDAGAAAGPARTIAAPVGRRDSVRLADGSTVVLAPGSTLEVAAGYGAGARTVALRGAAYFVVTHDAARPFVVRVGDAEVRDLGTAFTVRTDGAARVAVAVTEGIVALAPAAGAAATELRAGDRGAVLADGGVRAERGAVDADDTAWLRGRLVWRAAPLAEVRADLRRWYGIDLRVPDAALAERHLTLTLAGESADEVLRIVALALGGTVERRGDTATVRAAVPASVPASRRGAEARGVPGTPPRAAPRSTRAA